MNTNLRSTVAYLICGIVGAATMALVWMVRAPVLVPETLFGLSALLASLIFLWIFRHRTWMESVSAGTFFAATVILTTIICLNHEFYIRSHWPFEPFVGFKILAVFVPLICPPNKWAGWASLSLVGLVPVQRYYDWDATSQLAVGIQEPWVTFVFALGAGVIYAFKLRIETVRETEAIVATRVQTLERLITLLVGAQHLLNTPLQTIELLAHKSMLKDPEMAQAFSRAFSAIRNVVRVLSIANTRVPWERVVLPANSVELEAAFNEILIDKQSEI